MEEGKAIPDTGVLASDELTVYAVESVVRTISRMSKDAEAAHGLEDTLHQDVLKAIAEGRTPDARALAKAALKSQDISFGRFCS